MIKKIILTFSFFILAFSSVNAQFEFSNKSYNVPVTGWTWGFAGGGFTSMLNNKDDQRADKRLDPQMMNFSWAAGIEGIYWFQPTFGLGGQALFWNGGAAYKGYDSLTDLTLSAQTALTYAKIPIMFYFKSYNRYYPNRRFRMNLQFGPYVGLMTGFSDKGTYKDANGDKVHSFSVSNTSITNGTDKGKVSGSIMNPLDAGFVFGLGGEVRLWRRTIVALMIRSDVGISNVENRNGLKVTFESDPSNEQDFNYWSGYYAKYTLCTPEDIAAGYGQNRRATKNLSVGAFLSIRKYF
ncbi:MAG TPA: outer membrane beta-barrel protein [Chitinophagaceae bacterium]|nr:MAG: hypothetical protein UZ11_BCD004000482 [Bacteroidetes bacterium OLB11]HMN33177.1 outer membrane beta-barrel protein [Chitinophagaceae bacterium]